MRPRKTPARRSTRPESGGGTGHRPASKHFSNKCVFNPFTEGVLDPILLFWSRRKSPTRQFPRFTNHLEKMFHEGVDGNEKRYRMGGSPRTKRPEGFFERMKQVNDL